MKWIFDRKINRKYQKYSKLLCVFVVLFIPTLLNGAVKEDVMAGDHIALLSVKGAIGPATTDYFVRSLEKAKASGATAVILQIDTPGGLDLATRDIIQAILSSPLPIVTFVYPAGSRAASAGTYILYASHIAAMTPSTTLGAATPVSIGTPTLPSNPIKDKNNQQEGHTQDNDSSETTMDRKVVNDAVAFIRSLALRHGRNDEWAGKAVRQAATLTASEALSEDVIDILATDINDLLIKIHQREVVMDDGSLQLIHSQDLTIINYVADWRNELLSIITDPQIAYILLMIGIYGLVLEGYNPGALVPGVIGGICLITAFYALQVLPVNYAGLALIFLGIFLIIAEAIAPSFGILGIGGIVAVTLGSVMLIDSDIPGMEISYSLISGFAVGSGLIVLIIMMGLGKSLRIKRVPSNQALVGGEGTVESFGNGEGLIHIEGELWKARSDSLLNKEQSVRVVSQNGLVLDVEPIVEDR